MDATLSTGYLERSSRRRTAVVAAGGITLALLLSLLAAALSANHSIYLSLGLVAALALPILWWRVPASGVITLVGFATLIEQYPYSVGIPGLDAFTDRIPLFASLQGSLGFTGLVMSPVDIAVVMLLFVWLTRAASTRSLHLPRTQVSVGLGLMLVIAAVALARGLMGAAVKADSDAALLEIRPWAYLAAAYLLTSQLMGSRRAVQAALWAFVLGSGFKAIQGVYIYLGIRSLSPRPDAILAHEESVLFGIFIMLTLCLWLYRQRGRLRTVATCLLPIVLLADLANDRRDAFLILGAELLVFVVLIYVARPERRRVLWGAALIGAVAMAIYLPLEWNGTGTLGGPAEAVRSVVSPDPRDASSDQYRVSENIDLGAMISDNPLLGTGFGVPINYTVAPLADLTAVDSMIAYVPHNGVLYVWMRMGLPGEVMLWLLVAAAIAAGTRASRSTDPQVQVLGALVACTTVGWLIMGYTDMGFWWFRLALAFGCLLGLLEAAVVRAEREQTTLPVAAP
jgi:hypothetical protein